MKSLITGYRNILESLSRTLGGEPSKVLRKSPGTMEACSQFLRKIPGQKHFLHDFPGILKIINIMNYIFKSGASKESSTAKFFPPDYGEIN